MSITTRSLNDEGGWLARRQFCRQFCRQRRRSRIRTGGPWAVMLTSTLLMAALSSGCRAISRIGESRQSLTARKLSREGMQAIHRGRWETAEELFSQALNVSDDDDRAHRGLSESMWNRGERESAIKHMEKAVQLSAQDPRLVGRLGQMYLQVGRLEDAEKQCQLALDGDRNSAEIWTLRGDCYQDNHEYEKALAAYHRALALQPDLMDAKMQVAELYLRSNQYDRLLATLDRIDTNEESMVPTRVHMLRGIAMRNLDRPELARRHFIRAALQDPDRAEPHLQIAAIELASGRAATASASIAKAMQRDRELVQSSGWSQYLTDADRLIAQEPFGSEKLQR